MESRARVEFKGTRRSCLFCSLSHSSLGRRSRKSHLSSTKRTPSLLRNDNRPRTLDLPHLDPNDLIQHRSSNDSQSFRSSRDVDILALVADPTHTQHTNQRKRKRDQHRSKRNARVPSLSLFLSFDQFLWRASWKLTSQQEKPKQRFHFRTSP